ncbi:sugar ABC transporter permease [Natronosporangium hydrolyticum]|uniref:Sugar ABC transporter permease n=1 Tax=Natronosporangium hydrolyticum TaxID=2811111 RepID=A0A895Y6L8_9ACTN|nr:sugar ABC transporter permease [Natronosporangium hydrolyticum]QSB13384.1 sugar ABC transporter permease [Natronosporangium hydrolyticum]
MVTATPPPTTSATGADSGTGGEAADAAARSRRAASARRRSNRAVLLFLAPWFIGLFGLTLGPIVASLYLSFTDFQLLRGIGEAEWVGLEHYQNLADDRHYRNAVRVTLIYVLVSVPLATLAALLVAVMLSGKRRGIGLYRSTYYLPSLLGGSVAVAVLWRQIFGSDGLVNQLLAASRLDQVLEWFGIPAGTVWISNPDYAIYTLIVLNIWQFGAPMVIFLAGIKQIPQDLLEAAEVDGAGRVARFWRVTVPLLSPLIFFNLVLGTINAFKAFTPAYIISGGTGGPSDGTLFYTLYLYRVGFEYFDMSRASAMAWVLLAAIALFTAGMFFTARYWVYYGDQVKVR